MIPRKRTALAEYLHSRGLRVADVAAVCAARGYAVTGHTIAELSAGRNRPQAYTLYALADVLEVSPFALFPPEAVLGESRWLADWARQLPR